MNAQIGSSIDDRYRIEALLGEGAVGAVYRVVEISSGHVLALKQWNADILSPEVLSRFVRETGALGSLDHPNIIKVYGCGMAGSVPYMVLEHLEGQTLETLLRTRGALDVPLAIDIACQALAAIAYAHSKHVVHRDIKPENIFLASGSGERPTVKILDYGLAKFMAPTGDPRKDKTLTATGDVVGTPLYMPPEQATGVSVDLPADVYAMGCVIFEMLTGRLPFGGESRMEVLTAHMRDPVPRLADLRREIPHANALQSLLDRALAKKQTQRYPDAGAMLTALEGVTKPVATPVPLPQPRNHRHATLAFAIGVIVLAVVFFLGWIR